MRFLTLLVLLLLCYVPHLTFAQSIEDSDLGQAPLNLSTESLAYAVELPESVKEKIKPDQELSLNQQFVQSISASLASIVLTYPLNGMKYDAQAGQAIRWNFKSLYRGAGPTVLRTFPARTIFLFSNSLFGGGEKSSYWEQLGASLGSGVLAALMINPFEVVVTKQRYLGLGPIEAKNHVLKNGGKRAFFQGFTPTLGRDLLYSMGLFVLPNLLKPLAVDDDEDNSFASVAAAGASGAIAGTLSLPFDAIRGEMQRRTLKPGVSNPGMIQTAHQMIERDGVKSLLRGAGFRALYISSSFMVITGVTEAVGNFFKEKPAAPQSTPEPLVQDPKQTLPQPLYAQIQRPSRGNIPGVSPQTITPLYARINMVATNKPLFEQY